MENAQTYQQQLIDISLLTDHPRNYKQHPDDQLDHLAQSIRENGIYKNVVVAADNIILAGHGVVRAARKIGVKEIPVIKLPIKSDEPKAIKLLAADNEVQHLSEVDDRALSTLLKEIMDDGSLLGTGYDEKMLANLVYVTRHESEIKNFDEAAEWVGMPDFERSPEPIKMIVSFQSKEDREKFCGLLGLQVPTMDRASAWWPPREKNDLSSVKVEG